MRAMIKKVGEVMDVEFEGTSAELVELVKGLDLVPERISTRSKADLDVEELKNKKGPETRAPTRKKAPVRKAGNR